MGVAKRGLKIEWLRSPTERPFRDSLSFRLIINNWQISFQLNKACSSNSRQKNQAFLFPQTPDSKSSF
ncbi:MAG: hypothetical protein CRN43_21305 [Candidatus Nephrothrix sp. EaCA]|nr:MAG: hypothetical protein CRN43_21305 [Candidatus Nephrothrix sp. EaCA]